MHIHLYPRVSPSSVLKGPTNTACITPAQNVPSKEVAGSNSGEGKLKGEPGLPYHTRKQSY